MNIHLIGHSERGWFNALEQILEANQHRGHTSLVCCKETGQVWEREHVEGTKYGLGRRIMAAEEFETEDKLCKLVWCEVSRWLPGGNGVEFCLFRLVRILCGY